MLTLMLAKRKAATSLFLMLALVSVSQADDLNQTRNTVEVERGQVMEFSLEAPIDSAQAKVGDEIGFKLVRPLMVGQFTIVPQGWVIYGRVTNVRRAGKNCKAGQVKWKLEPLTLPSGKKIKVQSIPFYVAGPQEAVLNRVSLVSTKTKVGRVVSETVRDVAVLPVVILLSPFLILMIIGMSGEGRCEGTPGKEQLIPAGSRFYGAVSKDAMIVPAPASPAR